MKYLFAAIDARQAGARTGSTTKPRHNGNELKKLLVDASEGVDEKSSTHDFMDTLERIVNEIKNTSEHSGAFLQKVKKTEVADYYDVIKRPMDLATLMKRVKSQMYRNKKSFADDLDLIWSNCLLYNSHPSHPLRRSAEVLRQKSNQLLEFITDPSLPTRSIYAASVNSGGQSRNGGTPGLGDDDEGGDADGDSDDDIPRVNGRGGMAGINQKLMNGVNGDSRAASASPAISRSQTPAIEAGRKSDLPSRVSRSPSPAAGSLFENRPAIVRTAKGMQDFALLDDELSRLDASLGWHLPSTTLLPASAYLPPPPPPAEPVDAPIASTSSSLPTPVATSPDDSATPSQTHLLSLVRSLDPLLPVASDNSALPTPDGPPDALWWSTVTSSNSSVAITSGLPECPWVGGSVSGEPRKRPVRLSEGLGGRMQKNCDTLKKIRRLHGKLARGSKTADSQDIFNMSAVPLSDSSDSESETDGSVRTKPTAGSSKAPFVDTGIPAEAFRSHLAPAAARESLGLVSNRVLGHAGFDGANATALGVLAHVAAEYIINLGRTLRFYSDRYGSKMSTEQILLHVLNENGVPSPAYLESYVADDIDKYGTKLQDLHGKLERARKDQLEALDGSAIGDDEVFARDGEALLLGEFSSQIGEDFFGLAALGLDKELGLSTLSIPTRLFRGGPKETALENAPSALPTLRFPPPPAHIPLTPASISTQIGLLQPLFQLRLQSEVGLVEDFAQAVRPKVLRNKVPTTGRIQSKGNKRDRAEEGGSRKKKRKKEVVESDSRE